MFIWPYCLIVIIHITMVTTQAIQTMPVRRFIGYKVRSTRVSKEVIVRSMIQCSAYCATLSACQSASWNRLDNTCLLSNYWFASKRDVMSEVSSNWIMAAMMRYPVFIVFGPGGSKSISTLAEAMNVCTSVDAVIADPADLLAARSMGLEFCSCGFLSDGTAGFVLQQAKPGCWQSFHDGIIICGYRPVNVWCKFL